MELDRLLTVQEHRPVDLADLFERAAPGRAEDDTHRGDHLLVDPFAVLGHERQVVHAAADAEGVEQRVL